LWQYHRPDYLEWLEGFAGQLVAAGKRDGIAGVEVIHERKPV